MIGFDMGGTKCAVCTGEEVNGKLLIKDKKLSRQTIAFCLME